MADRAGLLGRVGGWSALASVWALTAVPAALSVYIVRNAFAERWAGTAITAVVESWALALTLWLIFTVILTLWGAGAARRR